MVHTLKVVWTENGEREIRRVTVSDEVISKYDLLVEKVVKLFPQLSGQHFQLGWNDPDGDYVVMSSDEELAQAIANTTESGLIRVSVSTKTARNADDRPKSSVVHPGVVCDGCNGPVCGYRYKCLECSDYDLCESCHVQDKHPNHDMLKITTPVGQTHSWIFPGWRRMYRSMFGQHPFGPRCGAGKKFGPKHGEESEKQDKQANNGRNPHAELLKNIGKSMAFFLDPLGIDVDVMVSESDGDTGNLGDHKKGAEVQTESKSIFEEKTEADKNSKNEAAGCPSQTKEEQQSANVTTLPCNDDFGAEANSTQGARPKNYGLFQKSQDDIDTNVETKESRESSPENFNGHDDWTVVNNIPNTKEDKNADVADPAAVDMKVSYPELPDEKMSSLPSCLSAEKEAPPQDPKIANALSKMCAMGFSNEGGWLVRLLETKNGNINDVLDALYPNRH